LLNVVGGYCYVAVVEIVAVVAAAAALQLLETQAEEG
jgi:hypothetical protein